MIVPMKKATIITLQKDADTAVSALRKLGVLHVEYERIPAGEDINSLKEKIALVNATLEVFSLKEFLIPSAVKCRGKLTDWEFSARHIIDLRKRIERLEEYVVTLTERINQLASWGDFDPAEIRGLAKKNIFVRLCQIPITDMSFVPKEVVVKKISQAGNLINCVCISEGRLDLPFKEIPLPKIGLNKLRQRLAEDRQTICSLKEEITKFANCRADFMAIKNSLEKELELRQAIMGMGQSGTLTYITGYLPFDKTDVVRQAAKKEKWGLVLREPSEEDNVPVLIRNPSWITLINPVFKFLEILPGYREYDISLPFFIFFSIFFGIIIGDAGYGLVYFLLTLLIQRKMQRKAKPESVFFLFYLLSLCAIIWGLLTGTFFGQEWVLRLGYKPLLPAFTNEEALQRFCFFLGASHLSIAHIRRGILKAPSLSALADLGSICVLWSVFFMAKTLILGDVLPSFCLWLLAFGAILIIIFTSPQKNIFKFAQDWFVWLMTLPFSFIGNFTDIVSYIRLFAVGMAGIAIADAFNAMAAMIGQGNVFMVMLAAFVALFGNTLGMVLGPVSVLVHGVRLNLLEFSGHMGLSWSGMAYKPLKE